MLKLFMKSRNQKGFTLVELIVVLVILGILAAILVPTMIGWIDKSKDAQYQLEARSVYMACQGVLNDAYGANVRLTGEDPVPTGVNTGTVSEYLSDTKLDDVVELSGVNVASSGGILVASRDTGSSSSGTYEIKAMKITFNTGNDGIEVIAELDSDGGWKFTD